jgi:gliding motility-associated lipoprotein GldD
MLVNTVKIKGSLTAFLLLFFIITACQNETYTPKPRGYFRISVKDTTYQLYSDAAPFSFEYSRLAVIDTVHKPDEKHWMNLKYPQLNADVFITYKSLKTCNLESCINDARTMVFKQSAKADDIQEFLLSDTLSAKYGKIYEIIGNEAACPYQFWLTDRESHFFRAALYFNATPNNDSIAPIIDYLKKDMLHLIETFSWDK